MCVCVCVCVCVTQKGGTAAKGAGSPEAKPVDDKPAKKRRAKEKPPQVEDPDGKVSKPQD